VAAVGVLLAGVVVGVGTAGESVSARAERHFATFAAVAERIAAGELERAMLADAADGKWDRFDLVSAAPIADRLGDAERMRVEQQLDEHTERIRRRIAERADVAAVEVLFDYLHEEMLTGGFSADCHTIGRTLSTGDFNCLSGTLLFVALAERCGVPARAVLAPSHVHARVSVGQRDIDVETTCRTWFREPAANREAWLRSALGDENRLEQHRPLTSVELLAVVYYNRGVERFGQRDFAGAAAENLVALRLDGENAAAADNLLAAVNNWALAAARQGRIDLAGELIRRGRHVAPDRADLRASQRFVAGLAPPRSGQRKNGTNAATPANKN
jgi:hypothetical protein